MKVEKMLKKDWKGCHRETGGILYDMREDGGMSWV